MLGRKDYTDQEIDVAAGTVGELLATYRQLREAVEETGDSAAREALADLEPRLAKTVTLALDRFFVHRIRKVAGTDGNPLNEVDLIVQSLLAGDKSLPSSTVIKYIPDESVLGLTPGDDLDLDLHRVDRLSDAFFAELRSRFSTA